MLDIGGDILDVRAMLILTRFVLMIWLATVGGELKLKTRNLIPWKLESIQCIGLATGNPLKIKSTKATKRSGERGMKDTSQGKSENSLTLILKLVVP